MSDHGHSSTGSHAAHSSDHAHHDDMAHHVRVYVKVFVALCVLTTLSFFTYSDAWPFKETPSVGWAFMMCVSCCKALLVMLFFMHLKSEADWKYVLTIPASIMSLFLVIALVPDIGRRVHGSYGYGYSEQRQKYVGEEIDTLSLELASMNIQLHHLKKDAPDYQEHAKRIETQITEVQKQIDEIKKQKASHGVASGPQGGSH